MNILKEKIKKTRYLYNFLINLRDIYEKFKKNIQGKAIILLYHRIADTNSDPLELCVSTKNFNDQIEYLSKKYKVIGLTELIEKIKNKKSLKKYVVVTFDDGYADNLHNALPILERYNVPATIFITSGYIEDNQSFYWDLETTELDRGRPLTKDELVLLSNSPLIEIGSHTKNHPHLGQLSDDQRRSEIRGGNTTLESILNKEVKTFAYPFGTLSDCSDDSLKTVKESNFICACANIKGYIDNKTNLYRLPRIIIRNWDIKKFMTKI